MSCPSQHAFLQASFGPFVTCGSVTLQNAELRLSVEPISITRFLKQPGPPWSDAPTPDGLTRDAFAGANIGIDGATVDQAIQDRRRRA